MAMTPRKPKGSSPAATRQKSGKLSGFNLRSGKLVLGVIVLLTALAFAGALKLMSSLVQQETYYVLNQNVPARTQVTPDMLSPIQTSVGSGLKNAKSVGDVQSGYVFTRYPLDAGDPLTASNSGGFDDIATGVPDSYVITNFGVSADDAAQGRITRGTYFDMMIVTDSGSYYPFVNMLALDTSVSLGSATNANAVNTAEAKNGQTSQYTVGMSPQDAAKLHYIMKKYSGSLKLVLSPRANQYKQPSLSSYTGKFSYSTDDAPKNEGKNTDYTFTPVKRDKFGRPIASTEKNCSSGNGKVTGSDC